jgi:tRNA modification GTPase
VHFGGLYEGETLLDEVVVTIFRSPHSYTKEDIIEISCHGSEYIARLIIQNILKHGVRLAKPGEFTQRAFLNGRFDLAQAEAVADLIASDSDASHRTALNHMRGGFSRQIRALREQLIHFASLIELELDFGEEDVEFADRQDLQKLLLSIQKVVYDLVQSFQAGNAIKNGIPMVIAGKPNAGKSTLLNTLLQEEKAIVSEMPGTTRDVIEDELVMEGVRFRIIDTAGLRETTDAIEAIGVARTRQKIKIASLILYLFDASITTSEQLNEELQEIRESGIPYIAVGNKWDLVKDPASLEKQDKLIFISAAKDWQVDELKTQIVRMVHADQWKKTDTMVTNLRHYQSLRLTLEAITQVMASLHNGISGDMLAHDIRTALEHMGEITGEITTDDLLDNIFSKFCIGK